MSDGKPNAYLRISRDRVRIGTDNRDRFRHTRTVRELGHRECDRQLLPRYCSMLQTLGQLRHKRWTSEHSGCTHRLFLLGVAALADVEHYFGGSSGRGLY